MKTRSVKHSKGAQRTRMVRVIHQDSADSTTPYAKPELTTKRHDHIIIVCASGGRSLLAAQTLQLMGYTNVVSMAGGFNEWSKQGFPVEEGCGEKK